MYKTQAPLISVSVSAQNSSDNPKRERGDDLAYTLVCHSGLCIRSISRSHLASYMPGWCIGRSYSQIQRYAAEFGEKVNPLQSSMLF